MRDGGSLMLFHLVKCGKEKPRSSLKLDSKKGRSSRLRAPKVGQKSKLSFNDENKPVNYARNRVASERGL